MRKRILVLITCLMISLLLTSCYKTETEQVLDYTAFYKDMRERSKHISGFLPDISDESCIEEVYLYYTEEDPIFQPNYTIYLNCVYSEEEYENEVKRINELFTDEGLLQRNTDSFEYESMLYGEFLDCSPFSLDFFKNQISWVMAEAHYTYVLFEEEESRIVYITMFEEKLNGRSINIPEEYLPKELVALREEYGKALTNNLYVKAQ